MKIVLLLFLLVSTQANATDKKEIFIDQCEEIKQWETNRYEYGAKLMAFDLTTRTKFKLWQSQYVYADRYGVRPALDECVQIRQTMLDMNRTYNVTNP